MKVKNDTHDDQEINIAILLLSLHKFFRRKQLILILNEFFLVHPTLLSGRELEAKTNISHSTLYHALSQLLELKLIAIDKRTSNNYRRYYKLTPEGERLSDAIQQFNKALMHLNGTKRKKGSMMKKASGKHPFTSSPLLSTPSFELELTKLDPTYTVLRSLYHYYPASVEILDIKKIANLNPYTLKVVLTNLTNWNFIKCIAPSSYKKNDCYRLTVKGKSFINRIFQINNILNPPNSSYKGIIVTLSEDSESSKKLAHDPLLLKQFEHYINANLDILLREVKIYREPSLAGLRFSFTGRFRIFSKTGARDLVEKYGGVYSEIVTPDLHYLVAGTLRDPNTRYNDAKELGIKIITEQDFLDILNRIDFLRRTIQKNIVYSRDYLTDLH